MARHLRPDCYLMSGGWFRHFVSTLAFGAIPSIPSAEAQVQGDVPSVALGDAPSMALGDAPSMAFQAAQDIVFPNAQELSALEPPFTVYANVEHSPFSVADDGTPVIDLSETSPPTAVQCALACNADPNCTAASWYGADPVWPHSLCYLKAIGLPCKLPPDHYQRPKAYLLIKQKYCDAATPESIASESATAASPPTLPTRAAEALPVFEVPTIVTEVPTPPPTAALLPIEGPASRSADVLEATECVNCVPASEAEQDAPDETSNRGSSSSRKTLVAALSGTAAAVVLGLVAALAIIAYRRGRCIRGAGGVALRSQEGDQRQEERAASGKEANAFAASIHGTSSDTSLGITSRRVGSVEASALHTSDDWTPVGERTAEQVQAKGGAVNSSSDARSCLEVELNAMLAINPAVAFAGRYLLLGQRAHGGQAVIQFARPFHGGGDQFAIKFFLKRRDFVAEVDCYADSTLRQTLPPLTSSCVNDPSEQGVPLVTSPSGFVLPPFIVMERGLPMDSWMMQHRGVMAILCMFQEVAQLLDVLHSEGRVHRDLKPDNILCMMSSQQWRLIDFGVAGLHGETARPHCTPAYAAPEVLQAVERETTVTVDAKHDIWALGVLVYECLTAAPLFANYTPRCALYACASGKKQYAWETNTCAQHPAVAQLRCVDELLACLSRNPGERPSASKLVYSIKRLGNRTTVSMTSTTDQ